MKPFDLYMQELNFKDEGCHFYLNAIYFYLGLLFIKIPRNYTDI